MQGQISNFCLIFHIVTCLPINVYWYKFFLFLFKSRSTGAGLTLFYYFRETQTVNVIKVMIWYYTGWRTKCRTIDCARNTFLLLQKHLTSGTELILIGWKIVPNEEHVLCDHRFASQPFAKRTLAFVTTFRHKSSESARHNFTMWALSCTAFSGL